MSARRSNRSPAPRRPRHAPRGSGKASGTAAQKHRPSGTGPRATAAVRGSGRRKRLGQHFLAAAWAERVVAAIEPRPGDVFLEIGPGSGALTLPLARHGHPILAVEIDRDLVAALSERVPPLVTVMSGDILKTDVMPFLSGLEPQRTLDDPTADRPPRRFRAVGNLPYYIASPILFHLIDICRRHAFFADATVMVQREVAERLAAKPGTKAYGVLTVMLGMHAQVERVLDLPATAFSPPPKVRSSVVRLTFGPPRVRVPDEPLFEAMVKALFGQRRKTLANALKAFEPRASQVLAMAGFDGRRRPETLQLEELARLAELVAVVRRGPML